MAEHIITASTPNGVWLTGIIDGYPFGIKVCDKKSGFGIRHGRVIKLYVNDKNSSLELFAYERGWERKPHTPFQQSLLKALLRFAAALPKQETWRQSFKQERVLFVDEENVLEVE